MTIPRREALENFLCDMNKLDRFLGACGQEAPINLVDPDQELCEFAEQVQDILAWTNKAILFELDNEE
jgi:hypothetical protein